MNKNLLFLIFIILALSIVLTFYWQENREPKMCFKNNCYFVEIAETQAERERGLMHRDKLDKKKGMFFVFEKEDFYPFWVENTLIPLDIIWLDKDYKVVYIFENTQPCGNECENIIPDKPAQYVLELNAGEADRIGLEIGSIANFKE